MPISTQNFYHWLAGYLEGYDPVKLVAGGAPPGEYESEARDIVKLLPNLESPEMAADKIYSLFLEGYSNSKEIVGDPHQYKEIASHVLFAWRRKNDLF
jgi:hypothetical protein